jgi:hypothetical protein
MNVGETYFQYGNTQCATDLCLVNHFQGRVTCPYGQSNQAATTGDDPSPQYQSEQGYCHVPGTTDQANRVKLAVPPQLTGRPPSDAVYCSCRCALPDGGPAECACPTGFDCIELMRAVASANPYPYAGSYCVKTGTAYDSARNYGGSCQPGDAGDLPCGSYEGPIPPPTDN